MECSSELWQILSGTPYGCTCNGHWIIMDVPAIDTVYC